jgi:hypothetical protein
MEEKLEGAARVASELYCYPETAGMQTAYAL